MITPPKVSPDDLDRAATAASISAGRLAALIDAAVLAAQAEALDDRRAAGAAAPPPDLDPHAALAALLRVVSAVARDHAEAVAGLADCADRAALQGPARR